MRMWNVDPEKMCQKHLCGEHLECHMFYGSIKEGKKIDGYIKNGLLEIHNLKKRHDEIVNEMLKRGYKHLTPLSNDFDDCELGHINIEESIQTLIERCPKCKKLNRGIRLCPD